MTKVILKNLDRYLAVIVLGLGLLVLTYSWFQTQQRLSQAEVNQFEGLMRLDYLDDALLFQRDSGSMRPSLTLPGGFSLLEYSDRQSFITVNGNRSSLWEAEHGYALDAANHTLYHTIKGDGWTLTKEITLGPANRQFKINYYYLNPAGPSETTLTLAHFHYYYANPVITAQGFSAGIIQATREQFERQGANLPPPRYRLSLSKGTELPGWINFKTYSEPAPGRFGLANILTEYEARPLPGNERVLIASEVISWNQN